MNSSSLPVLTDFLRSKCTSQKKAGILTYRNFYLHAAQFCYCAVPVFAAPPCPVELGADCVVLGPVPVLDIGPRFSALNNAIIATIVTATTRAPMPHPNKPGLVNVCGGRWGC